MRVLGILTALILSSLAQAETATYQIKGMHCGGCAMAIESHVCKMEGVKSCKVELTNAKKEMGQVTLATEDGMAIDALKVEQLVSAAGDYHIVRRPQKK